jgi:hypothetical protein
MHNLGTCLNMPKDHFERAYFEDFLGCNIMDFDHVYLCIYLLIYSFRFYLKYAVLWFITFFPHRVFREPWQPRYTEAKINIQKKIPLKLANLNLCVIIIIIIINNT